MALKFEVETSPESGSWNDYTSLVQVRSLSISTQGGADVGTCRALLRDVAGTAAVLPESGVRVSDGATVVFRGKIKRRGKTERNTKTRYKWYDITAQDVTCLLTDDIVDVGGMRAYVENDKGRIEWLVTTYGTKGVTVGATVLNLYAQNLPDQDFTGLNLYEAIAEVCKLSGGSIYVDTSLALHHYTAENNSAPFDLSDSPNFSTTFPYWGFNFPDDSLDLTNAVFVYGEGDSGEWVPPTNTWPTASQTTYGRRESAFRDPSLTSSVARQAAGNAIIAKSGAPRGPISMRVFRPGLKAGMQVNVTNSLWGVVGGYRIQQVDAHVEGRSQFVYDITFQNAPVTLQGVLAGHFEDTARDIQRAPSVAIDYASSYLIGRLKVVAALPALPDLNYPIGMQVFLTADERVYRNPDDLAWVRKFPADDILGQIDETQISDLAIATPMLQAGVVKAGNIDALAIQAEHMDVDSVQAGAIQAGAIGADALAAEIILARTKFIAGLAADSGRRVEIDLNGVRNYSDSEQLLVNIPTVGTDPVTVVGEVEASVLTSTAKAELRGATAFAAGGVATLQIGVTDPVAAPTLDTTLASLGLNPSPPSPGHGIVRDPAGDTAGTTVTYWVGADPTKGNLLDLAYEYKASDGSLLRTLRKGGTTQTVTATLGSTSHISDGADADGFDDRQVATPLVMPRAGKITKVSFYATGYSGGTPTVYGVVYNNSGTKLGQTVAVTLPDEGSLGQGKSNHYDLAMNPPIDVAAGTYRVGWYRTTSEGFQWDRDDGSGKTTYRGDGGSGNLSVTATDSDSKPNVYLTYTYVVNAATEGTVGKIIGVARVGTYIWVLDANGKLLRYDQANLTYVDQFDLSSRFVGGVDKGAAGLFYDGTNLIITTFSDSVRSCQVRFIKVSTAGAYVSTLDATGANCVISGQVSDHTTLRGGYYDGTRYWVAVNETWNSRKGVFAFTASTGASVADRDFGLTTEMDSGVTWDGTYFRGWSSASNPAKVFQYTDWDWTTASPGYWISYTWYDITGPDLHETAPSPRATLILGRRRRLTVSTPAIPTAGDEPADRVRVYAASGDFDPGGSSYHLQSTDALTVRTFTAFNSGGSANPTTNNFPAGTAAELKSVTQSTYDGWTLKGDGLALGLLRTAAAEGLRVQSGTVNVSVSGANSATAAVTFPVAFSAAPVVVVSANLGSGVWVANLDTVTASGFNARALRKDETTQTTTVPVNWIAIGPA